VTTATAAQTWPTMGELDLVARAFANAYDVLNEISDRIERLNDLLDRPSGEPAPTLEELGTLSRFIAELEFDLDNSGRTLDGIRKARDFGAICIRSDDVSGGRDDA
jgi:hypothetical protein